MNEVVQQDVWYVYVIRCGDGTLYCGATKDVARRVKEHNDGSRFKPGISARYTYRNGPATLAYFEQAGDRSAALRREYQIKRMKKADKEAMVEKFLREQPP